MSYLSSLVIEEPTPEPTPSETPSDGPSPEASEPGPSPESPTSDAPSDGPSDTTPEPTPSFEATSSDCGTMSSSQDVCVHLTPDTVTFFGMSSLLLVLVLCALLASQLRRP